MLQDTVALNSGFEGHFYCCESPTRIVRSSDPVLMAEVPSWMRMASRIIAGNNGCIEAAAHLKNPSVLSVRRTARAFRLGQRCSLVNRFNDVHTYLHTHALGRQFTPDLSTSTSCQVQGDVQGACRKYDNKKGDSDDDWRCTSSQAFARNCPDATAGVPALAVSAGAS